MNKQSLTELEFLNEKIKNEKQKVYSKGIVLLPGITTLTGSALANNHVGMAVGTLLTIAGIAFTSELLLQGKDDQAKQNLQAEKVYVKANNITNKN